MTLYFKAVILIVTSFLVISGNFLKLVYWLFSVDGSTAIYNLGLGFGAIIAAIAGLNYFDARERRRDRAIEKYTQRYPRELENNLNGWELVRNPKRRYQIFVLDHRDKTRHWIANISTYSDLFLVPPNVEDTSTDPLFDSYASGEDILTTGRREP